MQEEEKVVTVCRHVPIFEQYFNTKIFSDVTLTCSDGKDLQAHRFALYFGSSVFKKMIEADVMNSIVIDDINSGAMTEILRYIYTEKVNNINDYAAELMYGAKKYELKGLKELCESEIADNLTDENVVNYFLLAEKYDAKDLMSRCIEFIRA
jgi:speckle-type POZ protein